MSRTVGVPRVGVGVIVLREGKVLFGRRLSLHGRNTWCPPGGHLEFGESLADCAARETFEEAGVKIRNIQPSTFTNDFHENEDRHYVTLYMTAQYKSGEPGVMEPDKMCDWEWFSWDALPEPLFLPVRNLINSGWRPDL